MKRVLCGLTWVTVGLLQSWVASAQTTVGQLSVEAICQEASRLEADGKYEEAAAWYGTVPECSPDAQKAAVQAAGCLEKAGKLADAVAGYDAAIARNPSAYWAEAATFQKARACSTMGNTAEARRCIDRIKARFPDSSSYADALLLEAQMDGRSTLAAEALVAREEHATAFYKQAMQADRNKDEAGALQLLDVAVLQYPGTPAALRCRDARAHILVRHKRPEERKLAVAEFLQILAAVADSAPNSRIAERARIRLAALHHSFSDRQDAITLYQGLLNSEDKAIASRAALQLAGLQFEVMQREKVAGASLAASRWDDLRAVCALVANPEDAKPIERARAEVLAVESFSWQDRPAETLAAAEAFLGKYPGGEFKQDVATVRFFAGQAAKHMRQYDEAIAHLRWITDAYKEQREIWPEMDHLPRTYFSVWEILRRMKAPAEEVAQAADALLTTFPQSQYCEHVRIETSQDARKAERRARIKARLEQAGIRME